MALSRKKSVEDVDLNDKTVLMRVDFNVPFHPGTTEISDDSRIRASIPTIDYLLERNCRLVLCSHIGRPNGRSVEEMRMEPTSRRLSELLSKRVAQAEDCIGPGVEDAVKLLASGEVLVLENLRFHIGEESNDPKFAKSLASLADIYVDDAFGTAHRAHASTEGVTRYLPSVAGFLMARELEMLGEALSNPLRPFAAILCGAKVSDKIAVLENLAGRVDTLIVGGGMAATFLKAQGLNVGDSLVEDDRLDFASNLIETAKTNSLSLLLPTDVVIADDFSEKAGHETVKVSDIPQGWRVMDIGPETAAAYAESLKQSKTIIWNGPMGVFEWEPYAMGTIRLAKTLASLDATTVVGGGSTAEAVQTLGLAEEMTHVSTGGGASLEFMEGKELPGVAALMDRD